MKKFAVLIILSAGIGLFSTMFGVLLLALNSGSGIGLFMLITGLLFLAASGVLFFLVLKMKKKKELADKRTEELIREAEMKIEEIKKEFNGWLLSNQFVTSYEAEDLLVDEAAKKWCKFPDKIILDYSDIKSVRISKKKKTEKVEAVNSAKAKYGNQGYYGRETSGVTVDASTYDVFVYTNCEKAPLVTFDCDTNERLAEEIAAKIEVMKNIVSE